MKYETFLSLERDHNACVVIKLVPINQKGVIMSKTVRLKAFTLTAQIAQGYNNLNTS